MMLYPIPAPPSFAFHVVEIMSSPRYHLKRMLKPIHPLSQCASGTDLQSWAILPHRWLSLATQKKLS